MYENWKEELVSLDLPTPYFLVDEMLLRKNLEVLNQVRQATNCKILLAQKAFSMYSVYPILREYLDGTTASGVYEARLGYEEFQKETHVYSPAFRKEEFQEILLYADDIVFNSPSQLRAYSPQAKNANKSIGLRINPECSTQVGHELYDPCAPHSRLGTTLSAFDESLLPFIDGFHIHTLCEQNSDDLETTVHIFEEKFGKYFSQLKWINLGGGHHITRKDYDITRLINIINYLKDTYHLQVYLEPGEGVVYQSGFLITRVIDLLSNQMEIAILDTSAACHMPDVIEMPYRPPLKEGKEPQETAYTYRLSGPTCLAGDIIGDYSFDQPLQVNDLLCFEDMALYTMVKTNTFNGMPLPSIVLKNMDQSFTLIKKFSYEDFKTRLS